MKRFWLNLKFTSLQQWGNNISPLFNISIFLSVLLFIETRLDYIDQIIRIYLPLHLKEFCNICNDGLLAQLRSLCKVVLAKIGKRRDLGGGLKRSLGCFGERWRGKGGGTLKKEGGGMGEDKMASVLFERGDGSGSGYFLRARG